MFSTFNIARSGMSVQQRAIDVTSHNISNAATVGYSRQRVTVETTRAQSVQGAGQIGTGAQVTAIERVRDSFLDYQVRSETGTLGKYDTRAQFLGEVESIFNEPSTTGISSLMGKFFDSFQELSKQPSSSNARTVVAQQTAALCDALNANAASLEKLKENSTELIKSGVNDVNSLITQIDSLNQEIITVTVGGNTPNDLMDRRDQLVDQLSYRMNIVVEEKGNNGIDIKPVDTGIMKVQTLVNSNPNGEACNFSYVSSVVRDESQPEGSYVITYYKNGDMSSEENKQTMKVNGLTPEEAEHIQNAGIIWADRSGQALRPDGYPIKNGEVVEKNQVMTFEPQSGDLSGIVSVKEDIQDYMDQLDRLAKGIALSVNAIHSGIEDPLNGEGDIDRDFLPFFVNSDTAKYGNDGLLSNLNDTLYAEEEISAKNISINTEILNDVMKIKTKTNDYMFAYTSDNYIDGEGDGDRALAIANLRDTMFRIQDINENIVSRKDLFDPNKGGSSLQNNNMAIAGDTSGMKLDGYFKDTIDRLGVQSQEAQRMVKNQEDLIYSLEESRLSVSGVSLDEEMANLVQYQHSYNANAKVIATLDELLDVVVNGLIR